MNERVNAAQESNVKEPDPLNGFNRIKIAGFLVLISTLIVVSHIPGVRDHFTIVVLVFIAVFLAIYFIRNKFFLVSEPSHNAEQGGREISRGRADVQER